MRIYLQNKLKGYTFEDLRITINNKQLIKVDNEWYEADEVSWCNACSEYHINDEFQYYESDVCDAIVEDYKRGE